MINYKSVPNNIILIYKVRCDTTIVKVRDFLKLYFIDYAITVVPIFTLLLPSSQHPPVPQASPTPLFMSIGHAYEFFGYSISCTVLYIPMAIL